MTRDYRKGTPPPRRRSQARGTCAFWFLFGGVIGAFGVGIAWLQQDPTASLAGLDPNGQPPTPAITRQPPPKPQFDFYSLLPEEQVMVPTETPPVPATPLLPPATSRAAGSVDSRAAATSAPAPEAVPAPTGDGDYTIQVGSFRRTADAERMKAQLALLGIQTSVQAVTIDNGQTYYRVRTGAYDRSAANSVQARLKQSGHESLMMRSR